MNQNAKTWKCYIKNCPPKSMLDIQSGDILYMKSANIAQAYSDGSVAYDNPKFRPILFIKANEFLEDHPTLQSKIDTSKVDAHNDFIGIPLTTTQDNHEIAQFDLSVDKFNLHYGVKNNKESFARPINIFLLSQDEIEKQLDPFWHDPEPTPQSNPELFPRKIGHMDKLTRQYFLRDLSEKVDEQHVYKVQRSHNPMYVMPFGQNPTELHYKIEPNEVKGNPHFDRPAINDPDLTI